MSITAYLALSAVLFVLGVAGVLLKRSAVVIFMSIEVMLNAVNLSLAAFARMHGNHDGQMLIFFVMAVAAAEAAVGLAIIIALYRHRSTTDVTGVNLLKW